VLVARGSAAYDELGKGYGNNWLMQIADVDGDGRQDVVGVASAADLSNINDAGKVVYWRGSGIVTGTVQSTATLIPNHPQPSDFLGYVGAGGQPLHLIDLDRDGRLDIVASGQWLDIGGVQDVGGVDIFTGSDLVDLPTALELSV